MLQKTPVGRHTQVSVRKIDRFTRPTIRSYFDKSRDNPCKKQYEYMPGHIDLIFALSNIYPLLPSADGLSRLPE